MKKKLITGLTLVIICLISVGSYFAFTGRGIGFSGIYDKHLKTVKPFESLQDQFTTDFNFLYNEIKNNYIYLDYKEEKLNINWDELYELYSKQIIYLTNETEFFDLCSKFISSLKDGHSSFSTLICNSYSFNRSLKDLFRVRYIENKPIIVAAQPRFINSELNILGKEIVSINEIHFTDIVDRIRIDYGKDISETVGRSSMVVNNRFWEYFYRDNRILENDLVIVLKDMNDEIVTWSLSSEKEYAKERMKIINDVNFGFVNNNFPSYKILENNIAYINVPSFHGDRTEIVNRFNEIVKELKQQDVKGVVIDVRYNSGGNQSFRDILGYLTDKSIDIAHYRYKKTERFNDIFYLRELYENLRSESPKATVEDGYSNWWTWTVKPNKEQFLTTIPVALLVNEKIYSSTDSFVKACLDHDLATVIGNIVPLSGGGLPATIALPSGKFAVTYGFIESTGLDFEDLENTIVKPDIKSEQKIIDILAGIDTQIEDAVKFLSEKIE